MNTTTTRRAFAALGATAVLLAACGGSDGDSADEPAEAPAEEPAEAPADEPADAPADEPAEDSAGDGDAGGDSSEADAGSFEPGSISFRSVNMLDRPVDIYVRTTGLVEAFPIASGVAPGTVTDYVAPPQDGSYIMTEEGAGDATCVTECDHILVNVSGAFGEGPTRTVLLYEDPFSGPSAFELSEEPESAESAAGSSNILAPADPTTGLVIPVGIALDEEVFGFRVGYEGIEGCVESPDQPGIFVGGNQAAAYPYPGDSAGLLFFEQPDTECESPVADPVELSGGPGTRTLVILQGAPPSLEFITLELSGSVDADPAAGGDAGGDESADDSDTGGATPIPGSREEFVELILTDAPPGTDEQCVADIVNQLSDSDYDVIINNLDSEELPDGLSVEGADLIASIFECVEL